jgi:polyribonucleotide nucleotidyltransferase
LVVITSHSAEGAEKARSWVQSIVKEIEVGEIYEGPVTQIITDRNSGEEIGAIVELAKGKDGMIHISQLKHERVAKVSDVVKVGDVVKVKVVEVDAARGRISLSMKALQTPPPFDPNAPRFDAPRRPNGFNNHGHGGHRDRGPRRDFRR